jgi:hypothetical protein
VEAEAEREQSSSTHDQSAIERAARAVLEANWRSEGRGGGYTLPNVERYPWQWLWDSCFHAIAWAAVGDSRRAIAELRSALETQDADGFVPHMHYRGATSPHADFWGNDSVSTITQPPIYGHTVAVLRARGIDVPEDIVEGVNRGVDFLLHRRERSANGLISVVHPWETGCDDSPRWDDWGAADPSRWYRVKGELLASVTRSSSGAPLGNDAFAVGAVSFSALTLFAARELGQDDESLGAALAARWDSEGGTWIDDGPSAASSGRVRTLDALLPVLVEGDARRVREVLTVAVDSTAYGGRFGPAGVHRAEPVFAPRTYWRGSSWPQLTYLLWVAATRAGMPEIAGSLSRSLREGALVSGFAEHWDPDSATPLGARPQSWAALAAVAS